MSATIYKEFCQLLDELKKGGEHRALEYTNDDLAEILGVSPRTLYRWLSGDTAVPLTVVYLLRYILNKKVRHESA